MPRTEHALLKRNAGLGSMITIKISCRASLKLDNLSFCADIIVHPRIEMHSILECLKSLSMVKKNDLDVIMQTCWNKIMTSADRKISEVGHHKIPINTMINNKIRNLIINKKCKD